MQKKIVIGVVVALALAVVSIFFIFSGYQSLFTQGGSVDTLTQLVIQDTLVGQGREALPGTRVRVHYVGTLEDGQTFDSSLNRGQPIEFVLGGGEVIQGWDQGIRGMKVGGKRVLIIPPSLGYGAEGIGPIPPNATLIFEVELVDVQTRN